MAGFLELREELGREIMGWLVADQDALFSPYDTSTTFYSSLVSYLVERNPRLLITWAAETGAFELLERVVAQYPEATINGSNTMKLYGICPPYALVIAARKGYAKVVELIPTLETTHKARDALIEAAKEGHADVVSVTLEHFLGHRSSGFHDALSEAIERDHLEVKRVIREFANPACSYCNKNLDLTARNGKRGKRVTWARTLVNFLG
jgi:hypothetical protein